MSRPRTLARDLAEALLALADETGPEARRKRLFAALERAERDEAARQLAEVEANLRAVYAADPVTSRLVGELAERLREPEDLILRAVAAVCAPERFREELIREEAAERPPRAPRGLENTPVRAALEAVLRAIEGHEPAAAAARRALDRVRSVALGFEDERRPHEPDEGDEGDLEARVDPYGSNAIDPYEREGRE